MIEQLTAQLKREEGEVKKHGRHVAYEDHLGYLTIGIGRLIDRRRGGGLSDEEAEHLLSNDIETVQFALQTRLPWFGTLSSARKAALINMAFQLGVSGLMTFKKSLTHMEAGNYAWAAKEFLNSRWAKQTPARAKRVTRQIETGDWQ